MESMEEHDTEPVPEPKPVTAALKDGSVSSGTERNWYTVPAAAKLLGMSERGVRKRITAGTIAAERRDGRWVVDPSAPIDGTSSVPEPEPPGPAQNRSAPAVPAAPADVGPLVEELHQARQRIEELAGAVGFWQGRYQEAQEQIRLLTAPAETPENAPVRHDPATDRVPALPADASWWRRALYRGRYGW